jgi:superfamily II RNA helicase
MKTREEVETLKETWRRDPIWDLGNEEGFEEYWDELNAYREQCERQWRERREQEIEAEKAEAEKMDLYGLYKKIKELEDDLARHHNAIVNLCNGYTDLAFNVLQGIDN